MIRYLIWLLFAALMVCALAQFWFIQRVASALEKRHPALYRDIHGLFAIHNLLWFALRRRDRDLGDPDLSVRTRQLQTFMFVTWGGLFLLFLLQILAAGN